MESPRLYYRPNLDPVEAGNRLGKLMAPGRISDHDLERRIVRIGERFRTYAVRSPHGLWAPGLAITREMRWSAEIYLPLEEIRRAFRRLLSLALRYAPPLPPALLQSSPSWLDVARGLQSLVSTANPAGVLDRLLHDGDFRCRLLFSLLLPRQYGCGFNRYPGQTEFLKSMMGKVRRPGMIRCLDAACGSGEGTYGLARLLRECGFAPGEIAVHGATIEPLELFAAAHGWFPHDPARQKAFRRQIMPLVEDATAGSILFFQEDLTDNGQGENERYDLVLCNGLLGGPLITSRDALERTVERICSRLRPDGIFLAADHFHGGWKKSVPGNDLGEMLARRGLKLLAPGEGLAGVRTG
jgi:SAM-dependent methyltransferase